MGNFDERQWGNSVSAVNPAGRSTRCWQTHSQAPVGVWPDSAGSSITLISSALLIGAVIPAAAELMRVTFVGHAQSAWNASGLIDTSTPGPTLTQNGQDQTRAVVGCTRRSLRRTTIRCH